MISSSDVWLYRAFHEAFWLFFLEKQRNMLQFVLLTKVLLLHPGIWDVEVLGQMDCTVFPYAVIWVGLPFLDFRREFFVTWVTVILLTCLCLGYQFRTAFAPIPILEWKAYILTNWTLWREPCVAETETTLEHSLQQWSYFPKFFFFFFPDHQSRSLTTFSEDLSQL